MLLGEFSHLFDVMNSLGYWLMAMAHVANMTLADALLLVNIMFQFTSDIL